MPEASVWDAYVKARCDGAFWEGKLKEIQRWVQVDHPKPHSYQLEHIFTTGYTEIWSWKAQQFKAALLMLPTLA